MTEKLPGNKKRWIMGGLMVIVLFAVILTVFTPKLTTSGKTMQTGRRPAVGVDVYSARRQELVRKISLVGQTVADAQIDIAPKYSGRVLTVRAQLGQQVLAGQVLIEQDTGDIDASLAQNRADLRQANANLTQSQAGFDADYQKAEADYKRNLINYNRYKTLYETGAISKESLDLAQQSMINAKAALDTLTNQTMGGTTPALIEAKRAAVVKAERTEDALTKQRTDLILRAPRDGVIVYRQVEEGSFVQSGQKLMSLVDNSQLFVDCQVSEQDAAVLQLGMETTVAIESLGQQFTGKIIFISTAKESGAQIYKVRLRLLNPNPALKSGMYAKTAVDVLLRPQALVVPKEAVQNKNGRYFVYVVTDANQAAERPVQLGLRNDAYIEIINGIKEGEQVAVTNLAKLKNGMTVVANPYAPDPEPLGSTRSQRKEGLR